MLLDAAKALAGAVMFSCAFLASARAQPTIFDVKVEAISHGTVAVRFQVSGLPGTSANWIEYGPSHLLGYRTAVWRASTSSYYRSLVIGGLKPDSEYYFRIVSTAANGSLAAAWYCPSSEGGPGYTCDGPDAPPRFRTAPAPSVLPVPPAPPRSSDHPFPAISGQTFQVSVDGEQRCLDLQAQLDAAAKADPDQNHEVVIPAGSTCYGEFVLPRKLGSGVVVIRPSTSLEMLPPPGMRIDPSFRPLMATLSVPKAWQSVGLFQHFALSTPGERDCAAPCTEGWRLIGIEITHPDHNEIPRRFARITAISEWRPGFALFTVDNDFPLEHAQSVSVAGVEGAAALNRTWTVVPVTRSSFAVQTDASVGGATGGYVTQVISAPIESCGLGPRPICTTTSPHGLSDPTAKTIASISGADIQTPGVSWPAMTTVEVAGSPTGADGLRGALALGAGLRLVGGNLQGECSADCGTVRPRPSIQIFGVDSEPRLNGSRIYTVVSENQVQLDDVEEATSEASGGYLSNDPNPFQRLVSFGANARNIVLDRCWIHGRGFPTRVAGAIAVSSDDTAIVDSVVSEINSWRPVTRQGGSAAPGVHGYFAGAATVLTIGDASRVEIRNNLFENCIGITIYAEQYRSTSELTPSDVIISGNTFRNDDAYRSGSPGSNGRYYGIRHAIEFKRAQRVLIDGNRFDGNWADWTPLGPAIGLLTRAEGVAVNNRIQDVTIRNNVFRRVATGIQILSTDDRIEQPSLPVARVAIDNNLFENVDFYGMRSAPSGVAGIAKSSNFGGEIVFVSGSLEDFTITRNTAIDNRGPGPAFFWYQGGRSSAVQVTDNVFSHNHDFALGGIPPAARTAEFESELRGSASLGFANVFTQTPGPDPDSTFARNLVLPGVRDSSSAGNNDDGAPSRNFTKADCISFYAGFPEIECAGSGEPGETANQRIAAAVPERSAPRDAGGRGADLAGLTSAIKGIQLPSATPFGAGASIEFRTAATDSCLVDVAETRDFATFRRIEVSGSELHVVSPEGLTPGQTYYYRIKCTSDTQFGEITIPSVP